VKDWVMKLKKMKEGSEREGDDIWEKR